MMVDSFEPENRVQGQDWNNLLASLPDTHLLQTWQWGLVKSQFGWQPYLKTWRSSSGKIVGAAMILQRSVSVPGVASRLNMLYVPKGPILDWENQTLRDQVLDDLKKIAIEKKAFLIKIDPQVSLTHGIAERDIASMNPLGEAISKQLKATGWRFSNEQVQFRNTVTIDLKESEEVLLRRMKQKTRYHLNLAIRKGVTVRDGSYADLDLLYRMFAETSDRDGFVIRDDDYYRVLWKTFLDAGMAHILIAEADQEPIAGLVLLHFAGEVIYMFGMSRDLHREKMPNYLLQWKAIQWAKSNGFEVYDLWGAPNTFDESDPMWGVYRFKEGLGGRVVHHIGTWDLPVQPLIYQVYSVLLPRILGLMRWRGRTSLHRRIEQQKF